VVVAKQLAVGVTKVQPAVVSAKQLADSWWQPECGKSGACFLSCERG